jgi:selenocysteine lyase/cysteine desulfurase
LLGPLGTGVLYLAPGLEARLEPMRQGGTGSRSDEESQPTELPDRYETGNLNVPGIAGLGAGVSEVVRRGVAQIAAHEQQLVRRFLDAVQSIAGLTLLGPESEQGRVGVVGFNLEGWDPQELATLLDTQWSLQLRAGLHCAPRMHAALGTSPAGCVRASFGPFNTAADIDKLAQALGEIVL